jgi:hypothetical protein
MRIRSLVTVAVIVSFATALTTSVARAADGSSTTTPAHINFQQAIARAVENDSPNGAKPDPLHAAHANRVSMQRGYGGGGGHVMMVVSLVGMLAGVGMTYYMIKQMQKTTSQAATQGQ